MSKIHYKILFCKSILISFIVIYSSFTYANEDTNRSAKNSKYWITSGFFSYHSNRDANYNERNTGIGLEYHIDEQGSLSMGHYKNSVREYSTYINYVYTPFKFGGIKFGGAVGILDGYPLLRKGKFTPVLVPAATVTFKIFDHNVGINMVYIPTIIRNVDGSIGVQLKLAIDN